MASFFRRLAKTAPIGFSQGFGGRSKSNFNNFRFPFGAIAAISGGISYYYCSSSSAFVSDPFMIFTINEGLFFLLFDTLVVIVFFILGMP